MERTRAQVTGSVGAGIVDLKRAGLPCRKNCGFTAYPATDHIRADLLMAIAERNDHELGSHGYIHKALPTVAWTPFQKPIAGTANARAGRGGAK